MEKEEWRVKSWKEKKNEEWKENVQHKFLVAETLLVSEGWWCVYRTCIFLLFLLFSFSSFFLFLLPLLSLSDSFLYTYSPAILVGSNVHIYNECNQFYLLYKARSISLTPHCTLVIFWKRMLQERFDSGRERETNREEVGWFNTGIQMRRAGEKVELF